MKTSRANVEAYATTRGYEKVHREGIPDGFVWKEPDVIIGATLHTGRIVRFEPLKEFQPIYE